MNTNIVERTYEFKSNLRKAINELIIEHNNTIDSNKKALLKSEINSRKEVYNEVASALNNVKKAIELYNSDSKNKNIYFAAMDNLEKVAKKYNITYEVIFEEEKESNKSETKKSNFGKKVLAGLGLVGIGAGLTYCGMNAKDNDKSYVEEIEDEEEIVPEIEEEKESVDIAKYGMTSRFTDASDEEQVMRRAEDIYNKYINIESMPNTIKSQLSVERLANVIRMFNGELPRENGEIDYQTYTSLDEVSNIYASYCNSTSLEQYVTDLEFKPSCVFFEEGSLAHESATRNDSLLEEIYSDIRMRDIEKFREDSIKWGEFVRDTFIYNDFTGKTISFRNVDADMQFPLTCSIISPYMPSIFEFALNVDLATRQGQTGNTFGICIPYCLNENNEMEEIPLSKLIYDISYTPINALAIRAGMESEIENVTDPITVQAYNTTSDFYESKYKDEMGFGRQLK